MPLYTPPVYHAQRPELSTLSFQSVGMAIVGGNAGAPASAVWPAANLAIYTPFVLPEPATLTALWLLNGATATGNVDIGVYNSSFTRLISSGATAQSGTSAVQFFDVTDTLLPRGVVYLGISLSSGTATTIRYGAGIQGLCSALGMVQQSTAHPLPSTATPATMGQAYIPVAGMIFRSTF